MNNNDGPSLEPLAEEALNEVKLDPHAGTVPKRIRRRDRAGRQGRFGLIPVIPLILLGILLLVPALVPGLLAPHDPSATNLGNAFQPPAFLSDGSWTHLLGTDGLGRDIFSRIIYGARVSALLAAAVIALSMLLGTGLGIIGGYLGGWVESLSMRLADAFFSLPLILVAIALATLVGPSFSVTVGVMIMSLWAQYARLARGETLALKQRDFVTYAKATGVKPGIIMWRHIRPNLQNAIVVTATLHVGWAILVEASLSFIGAGVPPPTPAWGSMVADGRVVLVQAWWVSFFPGLTIMLVVLSVNLLGDWMRDRYDPRLRPVTEGASIDVAGN